MILTILAFYLLGVITGGVGVVALTLYLGHRSLKKSSKKIETVAARLKKVKEITDLQLDLQAGISGPQKNSLHGKHKNGLIDEVKALEEEKKEILKSIIRDGFDPEISTMDEAGVVTKTKLSNLLAEYGITVETGPTAEKKEDNVKKFTLHQGGKDSDIDDDGDDDGNKTFH